MPASSMKKRPPMEMEAGPDEIREGEDDQEMPMTKGKTNRKRSAKGAKQTKAPMDGGMYGKKPMDGEGCGCGGRKGKGKCDGSCGKKMDRNDALTPQEYLAACDLGIQGRSRNYIRARLDAAERLDKKCGASGIPDNKKCHVGSASGGGRGKGKGGGFDVKTALAAGAAAAVVGGGAYVAGKALGKAIKEGGEKKEQLNRINKLRTKGTAGREAARRLVNVYSEGRKNSKARDRRAARNRKLLSPAEEAPQKKTTTRRIRRQGKVIRLNSVYADGFSVDSSIFEV